MSKYKYRVGFKVRVKQGWTFSFWIKDNKLGEVPYQLNNFMDNLKKNLDSDIIYFKIERKNDE